jgi:Fe-S-cluster-containing hydrogenase component 2
MMYGIPLLKVEELAAGLVSYPEKCTGCRFCEMICSLSHEGVVNGKKARLRVVKDGIKNDIPVVCTQCVACGDDCCAEACPEDAIFMVDDILEVDENLCTGCGTCEKTCRYGVIRVVDDLARKCDLCKGDPMCVKFCPLGALKFEEADETKYLAVLSLLGGK